MAWRPFFERWRTMRMAQEWSWARRASGVRTERTLESLAVAIERSRKAIKGSMTTRRA
jgi:hypothetical protein